MSEPLRYQSVVLAGGLWFSCIESYESIHSRLRESGFQLAATGESEAGMRYAEPIELTVGTKVSPDPDDDEKRLVRMAFAPQAIAVIQEIPADLANEAP